MKAYTKDILGNFSNMKKTVVFDGIIVGIVAGLVSVSYRYFLSIMEKYSKMIYSGPVSFKYLFILFSVLTLVGLIVGLLVKWAPLSSGSGIPQVQGELLGVFNMREKRAIAAKYVGGSLCSLFGLSLGREGPSIQLGAACAKGVSKFLRRDINEQRNLISAGSSAGLAAAFSAPISGTIFILEEMYKNFAPLVLVPAIIASVIADYISKYVFGLEPIFSFSVEHPLMLEQYVHVIIIGIIVGLIGVCFNFCLLSIQTLYKKLPIKNEFKPIIAFYISAVLGLTFPYVLGGGHGLIESIVKQRTGVTLLIAILIVKLIFTATSYGSTAQGGIFLPTLVIGAIGGAIYYEIIDYFGLITGDYFNNFIILAMAGMLSSVVRSPILSIMLVTEMTGSFEHILTLCMVSIVSYLVAETLKCKPIYESLLERLLENKNLKEKNEDYIKEKTLFQCVLKYDSKLTGKTLTELDIPYHALIVSITRLDNEIIPNGSTVLNPGDVVTVLTDNENLQKVSDYFSNI